MARKCEVSGCMNLVFGTCKKSRKGYCKSHQYLREDFDGRSIAQKALAKIKDEGVDESMSGLVEDIDRVFSQYIRIKYARPDGMVQCFTGGEWFRWQDIQCGHFCSRKDLAVRWMEENCRPQSEYENCHLHGNLDVFKANLEKEHKSITEWILEQSRQVYKPSIAELKQTLSEYRHKLEIVKSKLISQP